MPDLFDNFFNKIGAKLNGGHLLAHYQMSNQVNTGRYYNYTSLALNNNYWLPRKNSELMSDEMKARMLEDISGKGEHSQMTEDAPGMKVRRGSMAEDDVMGERRRSSVSEGFMGMMGERKSSISSVESDRS